ncbi:DUF3368 domain-containing protein [Candidatus Woesearchaeota archaeon]|nr:DUF3368 domain-containing protein [Candidatus Woesearchaeota archaeon]
MIVDSSSLIILAKVNILLVLTKLYKNIFITKKIYNETVEEGLVIDAADSKIIKNFVENSKIKVLNLNKKYENFSNELKNIYSQLGDGESDAISLALQEKDNIIMDEKIGRQVCKLYNLKPKGTLRILLEAYKNNIIKEDELREIINEIIKYKFRIGADVINEFWILFEKIKNVK